MSANSIGVFKDMIRNPKARALLLAAAALTLPSAALAQTNSCATTLQAVRAAEEKLGLDFQNGQLQLETNRNNAILDCEKQAIGAPSGSNAESECLKQVNDAYQSAMLDLQKAYNTALAADEQIANNVSRGDPCPWSPEEITQFATQMTQATAQLTQSIAQVITAAKSKPGTTAPTQTRPNAPSTPGAPQNQRPNAPNPPANQNSGSPKSPSSPASPGGGSSSGQNP